MSITYLPDALTGATLDEGLRERLARVRYVFTDLDGTMMGPGSTVLANAAGEPSCAFVETLIALKQAGIEVIPNFFYIYLTYNTGIAFGLFDGMAGRVVNILVSIVLSIGIALYLVHAFHRLKRFERLTGLLLLSGAIGNMIDRVFYWKATVGFDGVIDFFQFYLGGGPGKESTFLNPFATFNPADAYLTVGIVFLVVIVVIDLIKGEVRKGKELEKKQAEASQSEKETIISSVEHQDAAEKSQNKEGETDGQ